MTGLEMHKSCEVCHAALTLMSQAYICSHECTYCPICASERQHICRNCGGELVRRPRRSDAGSCALHDRRAAVAGADA